MKLRKQLMEVALKQKPADLVLKSAEVFNVFTGEFEKQDLAIFQGRIAALGDYSAEKEVNLEGFYLTPGFIDSHVHIESGMVTPDQFAKMVLPTGTTTVIADPHEIANVAGLKGLEYFIEAAEKLPLNIYIMLPSCVPATNLETSGAVLEAKDLEHLLAHPLVLGLGEIMNYPGLLKQDEKVWAKMNLAYKKNKLIDGHAPGLSGTELNAYVSTGISSDHEALTLEEGRARLSLGMSLFLREGSAAKNLLSLLPAVDQFTVRNCMFATDDRHPEDLLSQGHINYLVCLAIDAGLKIPWALQMATINAALHYRLYDLGALAPGFRADILVFKNLKSWQPAYVFKDGQLVAENSRLQVDLAKLNDSFLRKSIHLSTFDKNKLKILSHGSTKARVIGLKPYQIVTEKLELDLASKNGEFRANAEEDILKLAVFERHKNTGNVGVGLVKGFGLKGGAIASTVAHDSHNLVVLGADDDDIILAVKTVAKLGGGLAVVRKGEVLGVLALPVAGLLASQEMSEVRRELLSLQEIVKSLGLNQGIDPFMTLSFLSLAVLPSLKLTDLGLVDVDKFSLVSVNI